MAGRKFTSVERSILLASDYHLAWIDAFRNPSITDEQLFALGQRMYSVQNDDIPMDEFNEIFKNRLREYYSNNGSSLLAYLENFDAFSNTVYSFGKFVADPNIDRTKFEKFYKSVIAEVSSDPQDLDTLRRDPNPDVRAAVAAFGREEDWNILRDDPASKVRLKVAEWGRGEDLDILYRDPSQDVRAAVAEYGRPQDLFLLKYDEELEVTLMNVARDKHISNESLDELVTCPLPSVREAVAEQGRPKDLDILRNDPDEFVRKAVAEYGRPEDLDFLRDDPDEDVRYAVQKMENSDLASMAEEVTKQREVSNPEPESSNHDKDGR